MVDSRHTCYSRYALPEVRRLELIGVGEVIVDFFSIGRWCHAGPCVIILTRFIETKCQVLHVAILHGLFPDISLKDAS